MILHRFALPDQSPSAVNCYHDEGSAFTDHGNSIRQGALASVMGMDTQRQTGQCVMDCMHNLSNFPGQALPWLSQSTTVSAPRGLQPG